MLLLPPRLDQNWLRPRPRGLPSEAGAAPCDAVPHADGKAVVADGFGCGGSGNGAAGVTNLFYVLMHVDRFQMRSLHDTKFSFYNIRATRTENTIIDYINK